MTKTGTDDCCRTPCVVDPNKTRAAPDIPCMPTTITSARFTHGQVTNRDRAAARDHVMVQA